MDSSVLVQTVYFILKINNDCTHACVKCPHLTMCSTKKGVKMAGRFLHVFITSYILTGTIAQQQFVLVASNTSSTSKQFVLVAPTTTSLIGISTLTTPASSPPAMAIMSTTRKSSNRYVCIKT